MSNISKRFTIILTVIAMVSTIMLSACGSKGTNAPATSAPAPTSAPAASTSSGPEPLTLPIVKEPLTLSIFWRLNPKATATLKDYSEMSMFQELEKRTGIKLKFRHPPLGKEQEQFNLMWASKDYPDLVYQETWLNIAGGPSKALDDKFIIPINKLVDQYAPNLKKLMDGEPKIKKDISTDNGDIYCFPLLRYKQSMKGVWGFESREDWLKKLNLQAPVTIDEWYTVLKAFKEKDPNGNGKADELPFSTQELGRIVNWVYAWGINYGYFNDNGKVKFGPYEPVYKEALTTLNKWYKEGLIDPDYVSNDVKQFDSKVMNNLVGAYWGETGGATGMYMANFRKNNSEGKIVGNLFPRLNKSDKGYNYSADVLFNGDGVAITTANKHHKESIKLIDYFYSTEGNLLSNFGIEGKTYTMVDGKPKLTEYVTKNPNGLSIDQALASHCLGSMQGPFVFNPDIRDQRMLFFPEQRESIKAWDESDNTRRMPPVTPTQEESSRIASIMSEVNTYKDEMFNKFVMGAEPLTNFDKYRDTLKKIGIEEALKLQQGALDRYNSRK